MLAREDWNDMGETEMRFVSRREELMTAPSWTSTLRAARTF